MAHAMPANAQILIDQERERRALRIARKLAEWDAYQWQAHTNMRQQTKQDRYLKRARELLEIAEHA